MKDPKEQQHRIHQKVGIINRIRKRRQKRKAKQHHQKRIILPRINNQHRLVLTKNQKKEMKKILVVSIFQKYKNNILFNDLPH